jgi:hypothetical protein
MRQTPVAEPAQAQTVVRCAIYTRKSTEEGLEQAFNSLDAQREAAEAPRGRLGLLRARHRRFSLEKQCFWDRAVPVAPPDSSTVTSRARTPPGYFRQIVPD